MKLLGVAAVAALALLPLSAEGSTIGADVSVLIDWPPPLGGSIADPITEPIVFDFEDGLQGWALTGSAQRVQTELLGGNWAIFGTGSVSGTELLVYTVPSGGIRMTVDLTNIALITLEHHFVKDESFFPSLAGLPGEDVFPRGPARFKPVGNGDPDILGVDVSEVTGVLPIEIGVAERPFGFFLPGPIGTPGVLVTAFIDNITFHPVPEPSTLVLLGLSLAGVVITRRRIR